MEYPHIDNTAVAAAESQGFTSVGDRGHSDRHQLNVYSDFKVSFIGKLVLPLCFGLWNHQLWKITHYIQSSMYLGTFFMGLHKYCSS